MAVYYKFKSAKDFDSIPIDGHFISIGNLKEKIFETKHLGRGTDFDLVVTNAQTNEGWFCFVLHIYFLDRYFLQNLRIWVRHRFKENEFQIIKIALVLKLIGSLISS